LLLEFLAELLVHALRLLFHELRERKVCVDEDEDDDHEEDDANDDKMRMRRGIIANASVGNGER
jgi:predicted HTH domain antitoxin